MVVRFHCTKIKKIWAIENKTIISQNILCHVSIMKKYNSYFIKLVCGRIKSIFNNAQKIKIFIIKFTHTILTELT